MFGEYIRIYQNDPSKYDIESLRTGIIAGSIAPEILMKKIL
jgi:fatty-acyl-CoA synthase